MPLSLLMPFCKKFFCVIFSITSHLYITIYTEYLCYIFFNENYSSMFCCFIKVVFFSLHHQGNVVISLCFFPNWLFAPFKVLLLAIILHFLHVILTELGICTIVPRCPVVLSSYVFLCMYR